MYSHRQTGRAIQWTVTLTAGVAAVIIYRAAPEMSLVALLVIIIAVVLSFLFASMTVEVQDNTLNWWFGPGFWKKSVNLADIASAQTVTNKWWWGWGIRYYGKGWLYNVSGLKAVEITQRSGKLCRIGTDDPDGLAAALNQAIGDTTGTAG